MSIINLLVIKEEVKADGRYAYLEQAGDDDLPILELYPEFVFTEGRVYDVLKSDNADGMLLRRAVNDRKKRTYKLIWNIAPQDVVDRITDLFNNRKGSAGAMWWTPVDGASQVKVRFKANTLTVNRIAYDCSSVSFELEEVL